MASPLQHKSRLDPVTDEELEEAKHYFVTRNAADIIAKDPAYLFLELNGDEAKYILPLMNGSILDLIELQDKFRVRMWHEAMAWAERKWSLEAPYAIMRIQDERCDE
jgi:hypothetical protein